MLRRSILLAWLVAIIGIVTPSIASAATSTKGETRVWSFELVAQTLVERSTPRTPEKHQENARAYDELASGSPLAAEGGEAAAQTLYHYTNEAGHAGILESPSTRR